MRRVARMTIGIVLAGAVCWALEGEEMMREAVELRNRGEFVKATQKLEQYLKGSALSAEQRKSAEFEIERMRRIRLDYTMTSETVLQGICKRVPEFTQQEFDKLQREGCFDSMEIDGERFYVNSSARNIFMRVPELKARQKERKSDGTLRKLYEHMQQVKKAQQESGDGLVCPQDFRVDYKLTVKADAVAEGKTVRCWLPYVRAYDFQTSAAILKTQPRKRVVAPADSHHRTIYLERKARKGEPTVFGESFVYRCWARAHKLDPSAVKPYQKDSADYVYYTAERKPHIDFSNEYMKKLNAQIVGEEKNPLLVAKKIYDWIADNMIYQYAREYSTIDNLAYYCASRRAGDCGQHGMVFIALCRMNGIPARWQTGWESFEAQSNNNMHDWSEILIEPYGWIPVDVDMAVIALRSDALNEKEKKELAEWLFGNQDHFRLAVNSDFGAALFPEKKSFRSETVDFQRGEVECEEQNLYFNQWNYEMNIEPISCQEMEKSVSSRNP